MSFLDDLSAIFDDMSNTALDALLLQCWADVSTAVDGPEHQLVASPAGNQLGHSDAAYSPGLGTALIPDELPVLDYGAADAADLTLQGLLDLKPPMSPMVAGQLPRRPGRPKLKGAGAPRRSKEPKVYTCPHCDKQLKWKSDWKKHLRTHTGAKPCHCRICGQAFADPSVRCRHERAHSGVKAFNCTLCDRAFTRKWNMERHILQYHPEAAAAAAGPADRSVLATPLGMMVPLLEPVLGLPASPASETSSLNSSTASFSAHSPGPSVYSSPDSPVSDHFKQLLEETNRTTPPFLLYASS